MMTRQRPQLDLFNLLVAIDKNDRALVNETLHRLVNANLNGADLPEVKRLNAGRYVVRARPITEARA